MNDTAIPAPHLRIERVQEPSDASLRRRQIRRDVSDDGTRPFDPR